MIYSLCRDNLILVLILVREWLPFVLAGGQLFYDQQSKCEKYF